MLNFVYGKAGAGKNDYIFREAEKNIKNNIRTFILVPEQFSMQTERRVISRLGADAQTLVEVLTFSRLCNMVMGFAGPVRMKYIDGAGKYIVAQRVMQKLSKKLSVFALNVHQRGFAKIAVGTFSEFKRYGVTPDSLRIAAKSERAEQEGFSDKLSELALIFEEYNAAIEAGSADTEDNLALILERIQKCTFLSGTLYINGFKSFTPLEIQAIGALMQMMDVCVLLATDNLRSNEPHFSAASGAYRRLCQIAESLGVERGESVFLNSECKFLNSPALAHLRDNFFSVYPQTFGKKQSEVMLYSSQDYYGEVRTAAKLILKLCREEGYRFGDIMVLSRTSENYDRIIPSVFERHGIRVFMDSKRSIMQSPLLRNINAVLEILTSGFSYERVMTALRSGFYNTATDEIDIFENYILKVDPSHAMWSRAGEWDYNPDPKIYDMELINRVAAEVCAPVRKIKSMCAGRKSCSQICTALLAWLSESRIRDMLSDKTAAFAADGYHDKADEYISVWNMTVTLITQLSELMRDEQITFEGFTELFSAAAKECTVGLVPSSLDSVTVGEIDRFRRDDAKAVIVLGVTDGEFPKKHMGDGLISDAERETLAALNVELAPTAAARQFDEQALIYSVLTAPEFKLILSASVSDGRGKYLRASSVFETAKKIFNLEVQTLSAEDEFEGGDAALDDVAARLGADGEPNEPMVKEALRYFRESERFCKRLKRLSDMTECLSRQESLSPDEVKLLYGDTVRLSVSKLEKYNSCEFSYFLRYGLLLRERDRAGFEPSNMGSVIHTALERYIRALSESGADYGSISREECFSAVSDIVESEAGGGADALCELTSYYRYLVMRMKRIAGTTAWEIVKFYSQSKFRPLGFEMRIGEGGDLPPREFVTKHGKALIEGFIDRADTAEINGEKFVTVTDYKLSGKSLDVELVSQGLRIQPLIYADALRGMGYSPAAMLYMATGDPIIKCAAEPSENELESAVRKEMSAQGWVLDEQEVVEALDENIPRRGASSFIKSQFKLSREEFENYLSRTALDAEKTADRILSGSINVNPVHLTNHDACQYCPFSAVCKTEK